MSPKENDEIPHTHLGPKILAATGTNSMNRWPGIPFNAAILPFSVLLHWLWPFQRSAPAESLCVACTVSFGLQSCFLCLYHWGRCPQGEWLFCQNGLMTRPYFANIWPWLPLKRPLNHLPQSAMWCDFQGTIFSLSYSVIQHSLQIP